MWRTDRRHARGGAGVRAGSIDGWDLAISGPRFRKVFTLHGPLDDLPGLVTAYVDAVLGNALPG